MPALDDYLHKYAAQQNAMGISTVFVWVDDAAPSKILIGYAVDRYLHARSIVGACAQLVDAKDEKAKWFFERYGFASCVDTPMTLYPRRPPKLPRLWPPQTPPPELIGDRG